MKIIIPDGYKAHKSFKPCNFEITEETQYIAYIADKNDSPMGCLIEHLYNVYNTSEWISRTSTGGLLIFRYDEDSNPYLIKYLQSQEVLELLALWTEEYNAYWDYISCKIDMYVDSEY